ncbi:VIR-like CYIR protein [Plasmodium cynomolgi strain B]|uniref:VIR-like CYIR protein n=1 Tax=Plasmodium cynomolgi (strain B) TaxID=1120755 RepID=K6V9T0_PLACD|nr:VIR-like CYIR protein [Plasmodium cynomolgi strain B]GAB65937.1 VIR-like CYIR protein [Plasmodium cynomolgi strain B]
MGSGVSGETSEPEVIINLELIFKYYNIFYDLRTYNDHEKKVDNGGYPNEIVSLCEKIQNGEQGWNEEIKKICEKLMKYFLYWSKHKTDNNNNKSICNYIEYLNYWLNGELRRNIISESDRHRTYEHFNKVIAEESNLCDLKDKFYNIKDEYYENMKIMHELYENFYKIKSIGDNGTDEKNECSNYVNNCVNKFRQFKDKCYVQENKDEEGYKKLCNALREFNGIYKINRYYQKSCKNVKLLDLPDILEELDDYKFYNDFNNKDYSSEFNEYCSEIKPPIDNRCKIYTLCAKIKTNLKGLSK